MIHLLGNAVRAGMKASGLQQLLLEAARCPTKWKLLRRGMGAVLLVVGKNVFLLSAWSPKKPVFEFIFFHFTKSLLSGPSIVSNAIDRRQSSGSMPATFAMNKYRPVLGIIHQLQEVVRLLVRSCLTRFQGNVEVPHPASFHPRPFFWLVVLPQIDHRFDSHRFQLSDLSF